MPVFNDMHNRAIKPVPVDFSNDSLQTNRDNLHLKTIVNRFWLPLVSEAQVSNFLSPNFHLWLPILLWRFQSCLQESWSIYCKVRKSIGHLGATLWATLSLICIGLADKLFLFSFLRISFFGLTCVSKRIARIICWLRKFSKMNTTTWVTRKRTVTN